VVPFFCLTVYIVWTELSRRKMSPTSAAVHAAVTVLFLSWTVFMLHVNSKPNKKLSYRRVTARCVVSVEILPVAMQQCKNYLYVAN